MADILIAFEILKSAYTCISVILNFFVNFMFLMMHLKLPYSIYHGDYCDRHSSFVTKYIDFSTDLKELCQWVKNVGSTGGGDSDECYELVFQEIQSLTWTPGTQRALVMIGDAHPHDVNYPDNELKLDRKQEVEELAVMMSNYT